MSESKQPRGRTSSIAVVDELTESPEVEIYSDGHITVKEVRYVKPWGQPFYTGIKPGTRFEIDHHFNQDQPHRLQHEMTPLSFDPESDLYESFGITDGALFAILMSRLDGVREASRNDPEEYHKLVEFRNMLLNAAATNRLPKSFYPQHHVVFTVDTTKAQSNPDRTVVNGEPPVTNAEPPVSNEGKHFGNVLLTPGRSRFDDNEDCMGRSADPFGPSC